MKRMIRAWFFTIPLWTQTRYSWKHNAKVRGRWRLLMGLNTIPSLYLDWIEPTDGVVLLPCIGGPHHGKEVRLYYDAVRSHSFLDGSQYMRDGNMFVYQGHRFI